MEMMDKVKEDWSLWSEMKFKEWNNGDNRDREGGDDGGLLRTSRSTNWVSGCLADY
jgi:hypothetical protein